MQANEFRLGNLIDFEKTTHIVSGIEDNIIKSYWIQDTKKEDVYICDSSEIEGIPLTIEWLEKVKFNFPKYGHLSVSLGLCKKDIHFTIGNYYHKLKYVHELQNMYFDFMKKQLTFKN